MSSSIVVALVGVPFFVVWAVTIAIARGRRNPLILGAASLAFVVAGWTAVLGVFAASLRCDDSCEDPGRGYGWRELSDAWQWNAQALLAIACFVAAAYILYHVTLGKPRRALRGLAVVVAPVIGLVLLGSSGRKQPYDQYPKSVSVPSGSNIKRLLVGYEREGGQREAYFVATGPAATHLEQAKRCVQEQRKLAKSAFCYAYPSEQAVQVKMVVLNTDVSHPCWTARWGVDLRGNEGENVRAFGGEPLRAAVGEPGCERAAQQGAKTLLPPPTRISGTGNKNLGSIGIYNPSVLGWTNEAQGKLFQVRGSIGDVVVSSRASKGRANIGVGSDISKVVAAGRWTLVVRPTRPR